MKYETVLTYNSALKKVVFEELSFTKLSIQEIKGIKLDKQLEPKPDTLWFRDMILEVLSSTVNIKVLKLNLFFTPNQPEFDLLGFLYLENKTILPIHLEMTPNLSEWHHHLTTKRKKNDQPKDWLLSYSANDCSMAGVSHEWEGKNYTVKDQEIYLETGKYLFTHSPKKFNEKKIASEKRNYLKKYINTDGQGFDELALAAAFKSLLEDEEKTFLIQEDFLNQFMTKTGFHFPKDLKTILTIANGTSHDVIDYYKLLSTDEILKAWEEWKQIFDDWLLSELKVHQSDGGKTLPMYTTPYWVPFMSDRNGNYMAIDYAPGKKGTSGQVIAFGADEDKIRVIADNLTQFIQTISSQ